MSAMSSAYTQALASPSFDANALRDVSLSDKYTARGGVIYLSGIQALVRLCLVQRWRDAAAGLNTAGFVSGYRGSPLGGLDEALWKAKTWLEPEKVQFVPGVNEDLAATAVWGSQQVHLLGPTPYDGVFGLWYGKGPGVDRSVDVLKHLNHAGTSQHGGVLLVAGDDHGAYSSTLPHQSDHVFAASMIPVLYPSNVAEYLELGIHGFAMSRFSGCAVGFKALADTVESSTTISADPFAVNTIIPTEFVLPEGGLNCRLSTDTLGLQARKQEALMQDYKIYAAMAYARANHLNRVVVDSPNARLGIVSSGKSYCDVMEALEELGINTQLAEKIGIRVFKVAMPWPLEPEGIREFADGLEEILVVEEKRQVVEYQLKEQLYNWRENVRPRVIGKFDERGEWDVHNARGRGDWLLPPKADFSVAQVARVIASRLNKVASIGLDSDTHDLIRARLAFLDAKDAVLQKTLSTPPRPAYYCSGCPHNTSTKVPEGSFALAGIGCHVMATAIYPEFNKLTTHMGGEGAPWIGASAFSSVPHVFSNLGDGTYFHSGYLAIRAAVAANRSIPVNITYKILYNDAVAMTGGQPVDGPIDVTTIAKQLASEGVSTIALVSEQPEFYKSAEGLPSLVGVYDRSELDAVQRLLREVPGVSALIYDQTCAAEKRRRRKKGELPEPNERLVIHSEVCEGCGDCGVQSNCTSILPLETDLGRKRVVDQSSCNKDYSCAKGFCPSFVTIKGGKLRKPNATRASQEKNLLNHPDFAALPLPAAPMLVGDANFNVLITGIGGTGVITIGALLGMAAHLEGKGASVLDVTGMSQKNGSVTSHVRLAASVASLKAQRIPTGEAHLVLGCDMLTAAAGDAISKTRPGQTLAVINAHQQPPGQFARNRDWEFPQEHMSALLTEATGGNTEFIDATRTATALLGDSIATNLFMLGYAFQKGALPLSLEAIMRAIELNAVAVQFNQSAFQWGRMMVVDAAKVRATTSSESVVQIHRPQRLEKLIEQRKELLTSYQNSAYAEQYITYLDNLRHRIGHLPPPQAQTLLRAVAQGLYKLMAYKDEYEVARLLSSTNFKQQLAEQFEGDFTINYNLAPPLLAKKDVNGQPKKIRLGPWMGTAMGLLAKLKFLRGTRFDVFGYTQERKTERALVQRYKDKLERSLEHFLATSDSNTEPATQETNWQAIINAAQWADQIRGYGHIKELAIQRAEK